MSDGTISEYYRRNGAWTPRPDDQPMSSGGEAFAKFVGVPAGIAAAWVAGAVPDGAEVMEVRITYTTPRKGSGA